MFDISKIEEQHPWGLNCGYNQNIDFCVWVLLACGLEASPFNYHSFSNQVQKLAGLDVQTWYAWLTLVVAAQDDRLCWHVSDISQEAERRLSRSVELRQEYWLHLTESIQQTEEISNSNLPIFDLQRERLQLNQYLHWEEQQYQQAQALAGAFSTNTPPAMIWQGTPIVREQLELLWREFLAIPKDTNRLEDLDVISGFYQNLLAQFNTRIPCLKVYLVQYPTPVFFPVPPVSILVSQAKDLPYEDLRTGIFQATETLATFH